VKCRHMLLVLIMMRCSPKTGINKKQLGCGILKITVIHTEVLGTIPSKAYNERTQVFWLNMMNVRQVFMKERLTDGLVNMGHEI
jgi:hypothetical protein